MKAFLAATVVCLSSTITVAQPATLAAIDEAHGFLISCDQVPASDHDRCERNHGLFTDSYVRAKAGISWDAAFVSAVLGVQGEADRISVYPGIRLDRREGCAWLTVQESLTKDEQVIARLTALFRHFCSGQEIGEMVAISDRATLHIREITAGIARTFDR